MEKRKFFVKASGWIKYKSDIIETTSERFAEAFYKGALNQGHIAIESKELEFDVVDITDEEEEDEEIEQLPLV